MAARYIPFTRPGEAAAARLSFSMTSAGRAFLILALMFGRAPAMAAQTSPAADGLVYPHRDTAGVATLRARASELVGRTTPPRVTIRAVYHYDPAGDTWIRLPGYPRTAAFPAEPLREDSAAADPVLLTFPPLGLFWTVWAEDGERHAAAAYAGPVLCNDVMPGPVPAGRAALCVPFADRAEARLVPDPKGLEYTP